MHTVGVYVPLEELLGTSHVQNLTTLQPYYRSIVISCCRRRSGEDVRFLLEPCCGAWVYGRYYYCCLYYFCFDTISGYVMQLSCFVSVVTVSQVSEFGGDGYTDYQDSVVAENQTVRTTVTGCCCVSCCMSVLAVKLVSVSQPLMVRPTVRLFVLPYCTRHEFRCKRRVCHPSVVFRVSVGLPRMLCAPSLDCSFP